MAAVDEKLCDDRYGTLSEKIDNTHTDVKSILEILRGKNGDAGLLDDVRDLKRSRERTIKALWIVVVAFVGQVAFLLRDLVGRMFS